MTSQWRGGAAAAPLRVGLEGESKESRHAFDGRPAYIPSAALVRALWLLVLYLVVLYVVLRLGATGTGDVRITD